MGPEQHPPIRTFKPRRGRVTARQQRGFELAAAYLVEPADGAAACDSLGPEVICEIGFGTGEATAAMARAEPGIGILAIDIHTPGVGDLLHRIAETPLANVRVIHGDALEVLPTLPPARLRGIRTYFPDPWPKARHHKRRFIQQRTLDIAARVVHEGGTWHTATDWVEYADAIDAAFAADPRWSGGRIARPAWRPVTRYETTALREGRPVIDAVYVRTACVEPARPS